MLTKSLKIPVLLALISFAGFCSWVMKDGYMRKSAIENPKIDKLKLQPGFVAEHLFSPSESGLGSWVAMAFDDKGRLITSDQYGGLFRLELPPIGSGGQPKVEKLKISETDGKLNMGYAHGLLYAFNSLYVVINNRANNAFDKNSGLYRLQDTNGDDQFDKITLLKEFNGQGEHGPHSIIPSPDGKSLYLIAGNHTDLPEMDVYMLPKNWTDDNLFPMIKDPRGHANDRHAPGGWIVHLDPEGKKWELISAGYRNAYDIAFNEAGDLFAYDADMEWDFGQPWYRPTRVNHVTSGSELGWRTGNQKWSPGYPDNLPALANIGQGSPTNLIYVNKARFPQKYRNTLFAFDWSFGIVHSIRLTPSGASYTAEREEFLSGVPLPLTDGVIGPDGALYFMTGGRRLASDVYRVYYKDYKNIAPDANVVATERTAEGKLRVTLEAYHGKTDPKAVEAAWPYLQHPDRFVRYAARIAVENQPVSQWQSKALAEKNTETLVNAMLALARQGEKSVQRGILDNLTGINFNSLSERQKIDLLRTFEVTFYRMGQPDAATKTKVLAYLNPKYPAKTAGQNQLLSKVLVFLQSPDVVAKTLALMEIEKEPGDNVMDDVTAATSSDLIFRNPQYGLDIAGMLANIPPLQHTYYAVVLSQQKVGWTTQQRDKYFSWFQKAFGYKGGRSYVGFLDKARKIALENVPKAEFDKYDKLSGGGLLSKNGNDVIGEYAIVGPGRAWKVEQADSVVQSDLKNRDFEKGQLIYSAVLCDRCHAIGGTGEAVGPDLTQLGTRFSSKDMLDAIIHPDKAISDQYAATVFSLKDGNSIVGMLVNEDAANYHVAQNPFTPNESTKVPKNNVVSTKYSTVSVMLPGLINGLNPDELKDLVAFLRAGGNKNSPVYTSN